MRAAWNNSKDFFLTECLFHTTLRKQRFTLLWTILSSFTFSFVFANNNNNNNDNNNKHDQQYYPLRDWQRCEIFLAPSKTGWGVYAARPFQEGEIVAIEPGMVPLTDKTHKHSVLDDYTYGIPIIREGVDNHASLAIFGMGMFFNHHPTPNIFYTGFGRPPVNNHDDTHPDDDDDDSCYAVGFIAIRDIEMGEELFSSYGLDDGGIGWFQQRGIEMQAPEESRISDESDGDNMLDFSQTFCSKIQSGPGLPTWKHRIPNGPLHWMGQNSQRLALFDAGIGDARAKVPIQSGERIEISTALVVSRDLFGGSALGAMLYRWNDLTIEHQQALTVLRANGKLLLQYQGFDTDWKRTDGFESLEDVALLPVAGFIGMVLRLGNKTDGPSAGGANNNNCRLILHSEGDYLNVGTNNYNVGVTIELIATQNISVGEVLKLNLPPGGTVEEQLALKKNFELTGMPYSADLFLETAVPNHKNDEL